MEVDQTPPLELDHLHVGEPDHRAHLVRAQLRRLGHCSVELRARSAPTARARGRSTARRPGSRSSRHRAGSPSTRVAVGMPDRCRPADARGGTCPPLVGAGRAGPSGPGSRPAVDRPEGRGGQGDEELGVLDDVGAHPLAAPDPGGHQLPGVGLVEAGARRADGGPPVLARDQRCRRSTNSPVDPVEAMPRSRIGLGTAAGLVDLGQDLAPLRGADVIGTARRRVLRPAWSARRCRRRRGSGCGS